MGGGSAAAPTAPSSLGSPVLGVVTAVGVLSAVAVAWVHRREPILAAALVGVVAVSAWLAAIDLRHHRLPNRIVGPLAAAVTLGAVMAGVVDGDAARAARAVGLGLAVAGALLVLSLVGDLGMGDVKYGYPMGVTVGWFGADALAVALLVMTVGGGIVALVALARGRGRRWRMSYGPYMALGLVAGVLVG